MLGAARLTDGLAKPIISYEDWVAAENLRSTPRNWNSFADSPGVYRTICLSPTGYMFGSPWQQSYTDALVARLVQHAFPSEALFNAQRAASRLVFFNVLFTGYQVVSGRSRNGYLSTTSSDEFAAFSTDDFRYYDGGPQKMNPLAGTGPTPYTP